jgi:ATP-dependent DNA helicase DinG
MTVTATEDMKIGKTMMGPTTWAEVEQNFARELPGYEPRKPQQIMATAIEVAMANGRHALVQAGCGTGKSLGGTVPMILQAIQQDTRVVVATATKALQEQYANKDIPFLQEKAGIVKENGEPFSWALVKGRSNYVCLAKLRSDDNERNPLAEAISAELEADELHSGDREHFEAEIGDMDWGKLSSSSNECPGKSECPFGEVCYAEKIKARGKQVDLVITNQAMLMTDLVIREKTEGSDNGPVEMLGDYGMVLFDEGHELPEYAANALGNDFNGRGMSFLARDCATFAAIHGHDLQHRSDKMGEVLTSLSGLLVPLGGSALTLSWFAEHFGSFADMMDLLKSLRLDIQSVKAEGDENSRFQAKKKMLLTRISNAMAVLEEMLLSEDADRVRWVEVNDVRNSTEKAWKIRVAPVNVGPWLKRMLWDRTPSVVMSATLSAGKNRDGSKDFNYIKRTLGLYEADQVDVGTPFDFGQQALMYVPAPSVPTPKDRNAWMSWSIATTLELIDTSKGGALLLFTSRKAMREAHEALSERLEDRGLTTLMQGDGRTNKELAKIFKEDEHSVLFALKSFFVGVDVPGEACRLVIIDKMPFPVPTDPIFAARSLAEERAGRKPFSSLAIPMMTLTLEQGVGRLIRTKQDRGVVALLDSRLSSTPYGRSIVNALPDFPVTTSLRDVEDFYAGKSFGR